MFGGSEERIIDQLLDFFVAGTQTVSLLSQHIFHRLALDEGKLAKVRSEIDTAIYNGDRAKDILNAMTYDSIFDLNYFQMIYQECLRMMPVASSTSIFTCQQDFTVGDIPLKKGDNFNVAIYGLHNNPE